MSKEDTLGRDNPVRIRLTLRPGKTGPIFKAAIFTAGKIVWRSYPAKLGATEVSKRAAAHAKGGVVIWCVQGWLE